MDKLPGLRVALDLDFRIAALRYFDAAGGFAGDVRGAIGEALPQRLRASRAEYPPTGEHLILAWRSPTETLLLTKNPASFTGLQQQLASGVDGCMVDQTGGIRVLRLEGHRCADLIVRLGACTAVPGLGEARISRLAELTVLTACVRVGEILLLVERAYADHLIEWIDITLADFARIP